MRIIQLLKSSGIKIKGLISSSDLHDAELKLEDNLYVQIGEGYYMLWRVRGDRHLMCGETGSLLDLLTMINKELRNEQLS